MFCVLGNNTSEDLMCESSDAGSSSRFSVGFAWVRAQAYAFTILIALVSVFISLSNLFAFCAC